MHAPELVERLVHDISAAFDSSFVPAEVRASFDSASSVELEWLFDSFSELGLDYETIESLDGIDFERFTGVGLIWGTERLLTFRRDDNDETILFFDYYQPGEKIPWQHAIESIKLDLNDRVIRFYERQHEAYAVIPGMESHWFFSPIWKNRRFLFQSGLAALLTNLFALGTSMFSMVVYNKIIPANAMSSLTVLVIGMFILILADYAVKVSRSKFLGVVGIDADTAIADRLFAKIIDLQYKSKKGSVGTIANTLKEYEQIREFFTSATLVAIIDMPFAVIFLLFMYLVGGWMVVPVLIGIAILTLVTLYIHPRLKKIAETSFEDGANKHSVLVETLSGLETIKILGAGGILRRKFRSVLARQAKQNEESKRHTFFASNLTAEVQQAVQISVIAVGAITVSTGYYGFGAIIACSILSGKALTPFAQFTQLLLRLNQIMTGYKALDELMKTPTEHGKDQAFMARGKLRGSIKFKGVEFTYPGQEGKALQGVDFIIRAGERVGIVGRVGSGKTTIAKLIVKLFDVQQGVVYLDGIDISQIDPSEVRENVGYVAQDPWLIAGTIEQNITLGAANVSRDDMILAAKLSGVADFVDQHPKGYKLVVKERGEGLSGGQRQAITVARALVRRPSILLFDEPTSGMDARSERLFIENFKKLALESTLVLITHRTSLLPLVDRVIIVDNGAVVGSASVEDFLRSKPATGNTEGEDAARAVSTASLEAQVR